MAVELTARQERAIDRMISDAGNFLALSGMLSRASTKLFRVLVEGEQANPGDIQYAIYSIRLATENLPSELTKALSAFRELMASLEPDIPRRGVGPYARTTGLPAAAPTVEFGESL